MVHFSMHVAHRLTILGESNGSVNWHYIWTERNRLVTAVLQMDGTWCPVKGSLVADSLSLRRLENGSLEAKMRKGGVDVGTNRSTYSADGRIMTGHWEIVGPGGKTITWTTTSERQ